MMKMMVSSFLQYPCLFFILFRSATLFVRINIYIHVIFWFFLLITSLCIMLHGFTFVEPQ